jgi:hypothetical protein
MNGSDSVDKDPDHAEHRCNHPLAVVVDPSDRELRKLEQMLAQCPVCSR